MDLMSTRLCRCRYRHVFVVAVATVFLSACSATSDIPDAASAQPVTASPQPDISSAQPDTASAQPDTGSQTGNPTSESTLVANAASVQCDASLDSFRETMLAMVNHSRQSARQCGTRAAPAVGQVQWNDQLTVAAGNHALDMVTVNFFDHTGSDGLGVADRADSAGYDWRAIGENIAAGQRDIAEVHQGWLDSPGHCRNIMNALYTEIGSACIIDDSTDFGSYWVVVFGDQR